MRGRASAYRTSSSSPRTRNIGPIGASGLLLAPACPERAAGEQVEHWMFAPAHRPELVNDGHGTVRRTINQKRIGERTQHPNVGGRKSRGNEQQNNRPSWLSVMPIEVSDSVEPVHRIVDLGVHAEMPRCSRSCR